MGGHWDAGELVFAADVQEGEALGDGGQQFLAGVGVVHAFCFDFLGGVGADGADDLHARVLVRALSCGV